MTAGAPAAPWRSGKAGCHGSPARLAVLIGSVRSGRIGPAVADWFLQRLKDHPGFAPDVIDLAELDLPARLDGSGATADFTGRVAAAEAFVVVTPEYNHGYPGPLKNAIDSANEQWWAKPVGFVCYGGMAGGLRAVEQLRLVFAELHAVTLRDVVSLRHAYDLIDEACGFCPPQGAEAALEVLLARLHWWAVSLRSARAAHPYPVFD